ncbi:SDR family oxidoreductase [Mucilaginibacter myungsuensis]|uniref:SDR family oxidoreductase n=1 Tax=Mucilaginibacter myungsuensis TaxID=649104 RepID=A0A929KYC1_9SPHI|nr:SDR family oxidoreductase [Mucilaginibacter myungsuensis]MBE9663924.1 SDR family oxidoreductase [Mucilaginibacter myungsuensis]MDN3598360.1 SDR family oxidoreductase [Mucilaginibacter myungsuensis]
MKSKSIADKLRGKTIVITGASSGAGRAAALEFSKYQVNLVLAARNQAALEEAADECRELGADVLVVPTDVTDPKAMINLANAANDWQGSIDVWLNNAGVLAAGPFDEMPMALHEQVIKTNLLGYMNGAHAVLPFFKKQKAGVLINNISIGGFLPVPYGSGYTASKFALRGFSEALKGELTPWPGIHVCDLFPAFLDTPGIKHAANYTGKELKPAPPVYDPARLAQAMVEVAAWPVATKYIGSVSPLLKFSHALFPQLVTNTTAWVMRRYFKVAKPIALSDGNAFQTVDYGMSTHGVSGIPGEPKAHRKYLAAAVIAGVLAGVFFARR